MPRVRFTPHNREVEVEAGTSLLDAASLAQVPISAPCGGEGACGECRVRLVAGEVESLARGCLGEQELAQGWVLACSSRVIGDLTVDVEGQGESEAGQILVEGYAPLETRRGTGEGLALASRQEAEPIVRRVHVCVEPPSLENSFSDLERLEQALRQTAGMSGRLKCGVGALRLLASALRGDTPGEITVSLLHEAGEAPCAEMIQVEPGDTTRHSYGLAIDVGTTTCAVHLVDLAQSHILGTASDYNAQRLRGLDVISRINYARSAERLEELRSLVLGTLNALIGQLCGKSGISPSSIESACIAGNTTMIHLLLGMNPDYIRLEPYTPTANRLPLLRGREVGLCVHSEAGVLFAPAVGSYVGGDITSGLLQTDLSVEGEEEISLFLDIGTNGEVVVGNCEWMMGCAASAGPAFEGFGIGCGMRAVSGAIERVRLDPSTGCAHYSVIGGGKPTGICGSGLVDLLAELWSAGLLDSLGKLNAQAASNLIRPSSDLARNLVYTVVPAQEAAHGREITLSEQDIINLLRAKAAVYSACSLMLRSVGLDFDAVSRVFVAGGFGRYLDLEKAITVGLLPDLPLERYIYLGNSSLAGAYVLLTRQSARDKIAELADRLTYLELNVDSGYMDEYTAALFLPHTDASRFPSVEARRRVRA